jgi:hypothetical protein
MRMPKVGQKVTSNPPVESTDDDIEESEGSEEFLHWDLNNPMQGAIIVDNEKGPRAVQAIILGPLAYHCSTEDPTMISLTSVTTGLRVALVATAQDAFDIAYVLLSDSPRPFMKQKKQMILKRLPSWVEGWIKECNRKASYVDPMPFKVP